MVSILQTRGFIPPKVPNSAFLGSGSVKISPNRVANHHEVIAVHEYLKFMKEQETHQEMRYPNVTSLYFGTPLAFNAPNGGVPLGRSP